MRTPRSSIALVLTSAILALHALAGGMATAAAGLPAPTSDPFYSYSGSLDAIPRGAVLRMRTVTIAAAGLLPAMSATQILYRTTTQLDGPDVTVATVIRPLGALTPTKLLSYQTFYDGVASTCRPSYTLRGGDPGNSGADLDETLMLAYVAQGYTVVTSDYEGSDDAYGAGRQAGNETLDGIRAAERLLGLPSSTPVGLVGYSGGSIASMWAAQRQSIYAPELNLVGVAAGGIPVDFWHNLAYIDGSSSWAGAIPAVGLGLLRAYHLDPATYLSAQGRQIAAKVEQGCLNPTAYPGLKFADLLKPRYRDWQKVPVFVKIFNDTIMGRHGLTPREPLLMAVGDADGTGDGVMVARDVQQLAYEYCQRGVSVQFDTYQGASHYVAAGPFETAALGFMAARYAGQSAASGCASITPGNPLTVVRVPKTKARTTHKR